MSMFKSGLVAAVLAASVSTAAAQSLDVFRQQGQMTCMGDVMMLCAAYVPDETRIIGCMQQRRSQLSAACRQVFDAGVRAQRSQQASSHRKIVTD